MHGVAGWFEKRGEIPLARPPGLREYGPVSDDPDRPDEEFVGGAIAGLAFGLEYCDSHGWPSTRTIRCLAIDPTAPCSIKAYCNVRRTIRTFRVDRVISIIGLRTGRILTGEEHIALLAPYLGEQHEDRRIRNLIDIQRATRDGVFALLQIAMADGSLREWPRQIVLDYIRIEARAVKCPVLPFELTELWVDNLAPPLDAVVESVTRLLADKDKFARLLPWLLKVARSVDGFSLQEDSFRRLMQEVRSHYRHEPVQPISLRASS
jgi:hypothetical protein